MTQNPGLVPVSRDTDEVYDVRRRPFVNAKMGLAGEVLKRASVRTLYDFEGHCHPHAPRNDQ